MIENEQARRDVSNDVRMSAQLASVGALQRSRRKGVFPLFFFVASTHFRFWTGSTILMVLSSVLSEQIVEVRAQNAVATYPRKVPSKHPCP